MSDDVKNKDGEKKPAAAAKPAAAKAPREHKGLGTPAWIIITVAALVIGVLAGHFLLSTESSLSLGGRTTLSTSELDSTIARYTYNGQTVNVSARDVISFSQEVDSAANDDGTYTVPSSSSILSYAQYQVLFAEAENRGIEVSDDETDEFAESMFGTADYATIASSYGMSEDATKDLIRRFALLSKLRDSVVTTELPEQPTKPTEPADGAEDTPTAEYASYIINLVGDEWDSEAGTWARTDGDYYATLSSYEITNDSATYAAASAAYNVAYTKYSNASTDQANEYNAFTNSVLSNASIEIGTLVGSSS